MGRDFLNKYNISDININGGNMVCNSNVKPRIKKTVTWKDEQDKCKNDCIKGDEDILNMFNVEIVGKNDLDLDIGDNKETIACDNQIKDLNQSITLLNTK